MYHVLFVCLGNICRSPLAEGIFSNLATNKGCNNQLQFDSAGLGDWHIGTPPDYRSIEIASVNDVDISNQRARQVKLDDFQQFDLILAMDQQNLADLKCLQPKNSQCEIALILEYAGLGKLDVPDPYVGDKEDFSQVFELISNAGEQIIDRLIKQI